VFAIFNFRKEITTQNVLKTTRTLNDARVIPGSQVTYRRHIGVNDLTELPSNKL